jgi:hypothetical protein
MKVMRVVLALFALLGLVGFLLTFGIEASFASRAHEVQVVNIRPDLLKKGGEGYVKVGPSSPMILSDDKAFLPGLGDHGERLADSEYLRIHHLYPLPLETVESMAWIARIGSGLTALACVIGYFALPRFGTTPID